MIIADGTVRCLHCCLLPIEPYNVSAVTGGTLDKCCLFCAWNRCRTFLGSTPTMLIYDLEILKALLVKDFAYFQNRSVRDRLQNINSNFIYYC